MVETASKSDGVDTGALQTLPERGALSNARTGTLALQAARSSEIARVRPGSLWASVLVISRASGWLPETVQRRCIAARTRAKSVKTETHPDTLFAAVMRSDR